MIKFAWQQFWAQWRSGDLHVLLLALIVAVTAITGVTFFTYRISAHLTNESGLVLGGDMVIIADHPIRDALVQSAVEEGLQYTITTEFPSMVIVGNKNQLAEIKALETGFPLRGDLTVKRNEETNPITGQHTPKQGEVWLEPRLANLLAVGIGDKVELGATELVVSGLLIREPSRGGDMFSFAPRLMMSQTDLEKTELIQYGSRIKYQLLVAGNQQALQSFNGKVSKQLQSGERIQDLKSARPEIKSALDRAEIFLGLAAIVSILLSVAAIFLASGPYVSRHIEIAALLRCFGASKADIQNSLMIQAGIIALMGAIIGCLLGYLLQSLLSGLAGTLFLERLPAPSYLPVFIGFSVSFSIFFALMFPNIHVIKNSPVIHILRKETETKALGLGLKFLPIISVVIVIIVCIAKSFQLALSVIGGILILCILCASLTYIFAHSLYRFSQNGYLLNAGLMPMIKIGLANLKRHWLLTVTQVIGFSLSAMLLILLMIIKNDLLNAWQDSLPADAPNRFVINIQPQQAEQIEAFAKSIGVVDPQAFPMIRGRLLMKNKQELSPELYDDDRAKRLVSREFNLSMAAAMQQDNQLLEGVWWQSDQYASPIISIEQDIATALNIKLGDKLTYDIAGRQIDLTVTSIRKVDWDSMRANFFAVTPPETLSAFPSSYMMAFYLPTEKTMALDALIKQMPNLTVIDVSSLMEQVRSIMQKMSIAVTYVFILCVVAGLIVLYAALIATREGRIREAALLRAFGASRRQVTISMLSEYLSIAVLATGIALIIANGVAYALSHYLFNIPFTFNFSLAIYAFLISTLLIPMAAWLVIQGYLKQSPKQLLNSI
jgi:putative ABC transport system permease protein